MIAILALFGMCCTIFLYFQKKNEEKEKIEKTRVWRLKRKEKREAKEQRDRDFLKKMNQFNENS